MKPAAPKHPDLSTLGAGFSDVSHGSQAVFRSVLQAMSHPGRRVNVVSDAELPSGLTGEQHAAASVMLALLDAETTVWLSPGLASEQLATWLRFHTGCTVVDRSPDAQFVWAATLSELPDLAELNLGTDASPEHAATCVVGVTLLEPEGLEVPSQPDASAAWMLTGPGIERQEVLRIGHLSAAERDRFHEMRATNHALFPRGVDVLLAHGTHLCGLPRTTCLASQFGPLALQGV